MFFPLCQKIGKPPANALGAWTSRGVSDWNHGTKMLKLHNDSKWHKDVAMMARIAEQLSVVVLQLHAKVEGLICYVYFLVKRHILIPLPSKIL